MHLSSPVQEDLQFFMGLINCKHMVQMEGWGEKSSVYSQRLLSLFIPEGIL